MGPNVWYSHIYGTKRPSGSRVFQQPGSRPSAGDKTVMEILDELNRKSSADQKQRLVVFIVRELDGWFTGMENWAAIASQGPLLRLRLTIMLKPQRMSELGHVLVRRSHRAADVDMAQAYCGIGHSANMCAAPQTESQNDVQWHGTEGNRQWSRRFSKYIIGRHVEPTGKAWSVFRWATALSRQHRTWDWVCVAFVWRS